jgi:O-antigen/teichoic acid export membrane protein
MYRVLLHIMGGRRNFRASGTATCCYAIARTIGIAALTFAGSLSIEGALLVNAAASVIGFLVLAPQMGLRSLRPTLGERVSVTRTAVPITVGDVAIQCLLGVDLWLLSAMGAALAAGVRGEYVAALSLARGPNIAGHVLVTVLVPLIARAQSTGQHAAAQGLVTGTTRFLVTLVLPGCALIAANSGELMALFFGEGYREGGHLLALLVFAQGFGFTALTSQQAVMIGIGKAAITARRIYVALAAGIALNVALIPLLGSDGAACAAVLAFALANALMGWAIRREFGVLLDVRRDLLAIAMTIAVAIASWVVKVSGAWVVAEMGVFAVVYLGFAWRFGLVDAADVALLRSRKKRPPEPPVP